MQPENRRVQVICFCFVCIRFYITHLTGLSEQRASIKSAKIIINLLHQFGFRYNHWKGNCTLTVFSFLWSQHLCFNHITFLPNYYHNIIDVEQQYKFSTIIWSQYLSGSFCYKVFAAVRLECRTSARFWMGNSVLA